MNWASVFDVERAETDDEFSDNTDDEYKCIPIIFLYTSNLTSAVHSYW